MVATAGTEPEVRTYSSRQTLHLVVRRHPIPRTTQSQSSSRSQCRSGSPITIHQLIIWYLWRLVAHPTPHGHSSFVRHQLSLHGPNCRPIAFMAPTADPSPRPVDVQTPAPNTAHPHATARSRNRSRCAPRVPNEAVLGSDARRHTEEGVARPVRRVRPLGACGVDGVPQGLRMCHLDRD